MAATSAWIQRSALPTAIALPIELVGRPVMLVELQRNDIGLAIPADGLQAHGAMIRLALHSGDEGVEIRRTLSVDFHDATACVQTVVRGGRAILVICDEYTLRRDPALQSQGPVGRLQRGSRPQQHPINVAPA